MKRKLIHHSKPFFDTADEASLLKVLRSRYISSGERAAFLGKRVASILGRKWAIPVQSGTDAMVAALKLLVPDKGAKVAIPAYVCSAPLDAISMAGCRPLPIDIDRDTLAIDPSAVNRIKDVSAVIGAHLFGIPAPLQAIRSRNLIEDCAQTIGVKAGNRKVGSMGRLSVCSFYATKLLATGHGGAIAGDDMSLYCRAMDLFDHDNRERWEPHLHFKMSDLNAALGISQIGKLGMFISRRREIASRYSAALGDSSIPDGCFSRYLVVSREMDAPELADLFMRSGIEAKRPVFKPAFMYLGQPAVEFPNAAWAHRKILSVPIYPGMEEGQIRRIEKLLGEHRHEISCWPSA